MTEYARAPRDPAIAITAMAILIRCCDQMGIHSHAMWPTTEASEVRGTDWAAQAGMLRCNARLLGQRRAEQWMYLSSVVVRSKLLSGLSFVRRVGRKRGRPYFMGALL